MRYLACEEGALNTETGECSAEVWVASPWASFFPTVEQAQTVGGAFFVSLLVLAVMKRLLKPSKEIDS